tara:strand:- start:311 stop:649 length:339 start_codon:yes stop_codon:yes gene_type:complete
MPYKRYDGRIAFANSNLLYAGQFLRRDVNMIAHYQTPNISFPTVEEIMDLTILSHMWTFGDRFYKLSDLYYGDPNYWWIIAWFNQTPLETDIKLGDVLSIPLPLDELTSYFR